MFDILILPLDIVYRILTRLSINSVHRLRCVSKRWKTVVSSPHFITTYVSAHSSADSLGRWLILERNLTPLPTDSTPLQLASVPNVSIFSVKRHVLCPPGKDSCIPAALQSSAGLLFCSTFDHQSLFIINLSTKIWTRIPPSVHPFDNIKSGVAFITQLHPENPGLVAKFVVAEYQRIQQDNYAVIMCFSSDKRRWVTKRVEQVLNYNAVPPSWCFEFQGRLFWGFTSGVLVIWEDDPFTVARNRDKAQCRLIPLPASVVAGQTRTIGVSGSHIRLVELREDVAEAKMWRLEDTETGVWSVMYKLKSEDFLRYSWFRLRFTRREVWLCHPYKEDTVVIHAYGYVVLYNLRTAEVVGMARCYTRGIFLHKLPLWPTSLPPRFRKNT